MRNWKMMLWIYYLYEQKILYCITGNFLQIRYKGVLKSIDPEAVFTKVKMNKELNINFFFKIAHYAFIKPIKR